MITAAAAAAVVVVAGALITWRITGDAVRAGDRPTTVDTTGASTTSTTATVRRRAMVPIARHLGGPSSTKTHEHDDERHPPQLGGERGTHHAAACPDYDAYGRATRSGCATPARPSADPGAVGAAIDGLFGPATRSVGARVQQVARPRGRRLVGSADLGGDVPGRCAGHRCRR